MKGTYFCYYFCGLSVFMELTVYTTCSDCYDTINVSCFSYWNKTLFLKHIVHMNYSQSWCFIWVCRCFSIVSTVSPVLINFIDYLHLKAVNTHCKLCILLKVSDTHCFISFQKQLLFNGSSFNTVNVLVVLSFVVFNFVYTRW